MDDINEIRNRINEKRSTNIFLDFIKGILLVCTLILGFLIYAKNDAEATFINNVFNTNISFVKMNETIDLYVSNLLSNFNIFTSSESSSELQVSNSVSYIRKNGNYFYTSSNYVESLENGKVVKIEENDKTFNITIFYKNEVTACYYDLSSLNVSYLDYLNKGDIIGTYDGSFKVLFQVNGNMISYEQALSL